MSSKFLKDIKRPSDPFYVRLIKGSDVILPEFTNRGVFYTGTSGFSGTVVSNATNPLFDVKDYIYTSGSSSNLDFWGYTYTIPAGMLGKDASFKFNFKVATSNFTVNAYALCTSGNKLIYTSQPITIGTSLYEAVFNIPTDCTGLKLGWQYTGTASGETFEYDNVIFSQWTPQAVNLVEQESVRYSGANLLTTTGAIRFNSAGFNKLPSNLYSYDSATGYFTPKKKIVFSGGVSLSITTSAENFFLRRVSDNAVLATSNTTPPSASYFATLSFSVELTASESVYFATNATLSNVNTDKLSITATAISENVVQSWQPSDRIGETIYLPQNVAPRGFISAMGSSIGKDSGTYQGDTYYNLYKVLWNVALNTAGQPYYISSAKGTDALTDWNAGKTITIDESGLFTRAYKSGVSGNVGEKQTDDFKSHTHIQNAHTHTIPKGYDGGGSDGTVASANYNQVGTISSSSVTATNQNTGGVETRPVNVAKYVFIRYATSEPVVLALPAATQTEYVLEVNGNASQSVANTTAIPFANIVTNKNMNWSGNSATVPLGGMYKISGAILTSNSGGWGISFYVNGSHRKSLWNIIGTGTSSSFSGEIYLNQNDVIDVRQTNTTTALNLSPTTTAHWLSITRLNGKNDSVFVGNVAKNQVATLYANQANVSSVAGGFIDLTFDGAFGDTSIVNHTAGQATFTLQPGEYLIDATSTAYKTDGSFLDLFSSTQIAFGVFSSSASSDSAIVPITASFRKIEITVPTTLKIRQYTATAGGSLGNTAWFAYRATVRITKLNGQ